MERKTGKRQLDKNRSKTVRPKKEKGKKKDVHVAIKVLAVVFIVIGILGTVLPVIPGVPFFILGVILLGEESPLGQKIISYLPARVREEIKKRQQKR